ncbi:hypothetical protein SteCoe_32494 [Stentor coeruleus]|uniref:Uncharacterized protein n=1 Tax=Stentor coeruleus TaxID=5963 RepID=A0A1R2AYX0_9CILI|nr:hypothetical protein SteCoe_32494 [Stentor coeruleus]
MNTPAFIINTNGRQCELKFLSYKKSNESQKNFSRIVKQIAETTSTLILNPLWTSYDFIVSNKVAYINQFDQEVIFMCDLPNSPWVKIAFLSIDTIKQLCIIENNCIHLCYKIKENISIRFLERCIDNYLIKFETLDKIIFHDISLELKQKSIRFKEQDNEIVYYNTRLSFKKYRRYRVQINVNSGIVGIKIFIDANSDDKKYFNMQGFAKLKKYFSVINSFIDFGIFSCSLETMEIFYSINYHDFRSFESNEQQKSYPEIMLLMQKYLDIYGLHLENIHKILVQDIPIEIITENGKILKCPKQKINQKVVKILSSEEALLEKNIIKCLDSSNDYFFSSRFKYNSIQINGNTFTYNSPSEGETFTEICEKLSSETIDSIIELAEELAIQNLYFKDNKFPIENFVWILQRQNLYFKDNKFPIENFVWILQRPIYTYNEPLNKFLEIREQENSANYFRLLLEDLQMLVLSMNRDRIKKNCSF